ncbi:TIR domain-containing protein [Candidatus Latescibacterota bacterium]
MFEDNTVPPFDAYDGDDPFIFVSYSHSEKHLVYPELKRLHNLNYRIWYDEGIDPGNEWPDEIANALSQCSFFVVYISPKSVQSKNVINEINYAINKNKPIIAIYLKETQLPPGLELQIAQIQAIMKYRMNDSMYYRKLEKTIPLDFKNSGDRVKPRSSKSIWKKIGLDRKKKYPSSGIDLRGSTVWVTIMMTSVKGFTAISEQLSPKEIISNVYEYLKGLSIPIIDNSGLVHKIHGTSIFAVFGLSEETNHRKNACFAALNANIDSTKKIHEAMINNRTPLITQIGIHTGRITVGEIQIAGNDELLIMGDHINTANEIEGLNTFFNTNILVSENTRYSVGDDFEFRLIDTIKFKGHVKSVGLYELLGLKGDVNPDTMQFRDDYEKALEYYCNKDFENAHRIFGQHENDGPSVVMNNRCEEFLKNPPHDDWDGIWLLTVK